MTVPIKNMIVPSPIPANIAIFFKLLLGCFRAWLVGCPMSIWAVGIWKNIIVFFPMLLRAILYLFGNATIQCRHKPEVRTCLVHKLIDPHLLFQFLDFVSRNLQWLVRVFPSVQRNVLRFSIGLILIKITPVPFSNYANPSIVNLHNGVFEHIETKSFKSCFSLRVVKSPAREMWGDL